MYYYNNELPPQQGWICPKCGRVNAPWLPTCGCVSSQTRATFDTTSLTDRKTEPQMREATAEERQAVKDYIDSISVPTGVNVFDFMDEPQTERSE